MSSSESVISGWKHSKIRNIYRAFHVYELCNAIQDMSLDESFCTIITFVFNSLWVPDALWGLTSDGKFPYLYHIYKVSPWCEQVDQNKPPQIMPLWPKGDFEVKATEKQ